MTTPETPIGRIDQRGATAAELDASLLTDLRQWHARQSPDHLAQHGARLTGEELAMLLRIADEREDLKLEARGRTNDDHARRVLDALPTEAERMKRPTPPTIATLPPNFHPATRPERIDVYDHGSLVKTVELPAPSADRDACSHDESSLVNGGLVCSACGKLVAWVVFKRPSA